jgi:hypothetical protein
MGMPGGDYNQNTKLFRTRSPRCSRLISCARKS